MKRMTYLVVGAMALLLASCATPGFERAWKKSVSASPAKAGDVTGPWTGEWASDANGHTGKLRCLVERKDEDTLSFRYWASWHGWLTGTFRLDGEAQRRADGSYLVRGDKRMIPWGTYSHEAEIDPSRFDATFSSGQQNLGTFRMERPNAD